jgi:plastocyanin
MIPVAAAAAVIIGSTGCASSTKHTAGTPSAGAASGALTIKNFAFSPTPLTASVGNSITVTNNDSTDHTVTDGNRAFDTGHIAPGKSKTITISKPGTYAYHCNIHSFMKGVIQVS